ncbi:hypothetical protein [Flavobacterium filum]|uniref:hypothetical protein n=1 Tax=Flavobacterium filum TaxID=370974 RepID=UPI0023F17A3C|nr:hypothetical protein [Flavobacterium filum]
MNNKNKDQELENLILGCNKDTTYASRINKELDLIKKQGSAEFFLTAFEIVKDLKQKGVIVGPANGFANSSIINFILGFTTIDPIKFDLIPETYFTLDYPFLKINVSNKKQISKNHLKFLKHTEFKIEELLILKKYQDNAIKPNYKFNPKKLESNHLEIDFKKSATFHFYNWEMERRAIRIENENDLINSIALSYSGLKGFHLSSILQDKHYTFNELTTTNKLLLFQEQWITLVTKFTDTKIDDVFKIKLSIGKGKFSLINFSKLFPINFDKKKIKYLFEIVLYLPSKSHSVAEAHILSLSLNFKDKKSKA